MTNEDKALLFTDLCGRLPYEVQCEYTSIQKGLELYNVIGTLTCVEKIVNSYKVEVDRHLVGFSDFKPYLRPLSDMSELESVYYNTAFVYKKFHEKTDWLNAHHFDYRGLIEKGLALEAPKDMYEKIKKL